MDNKTQYEKTVKIIAVYANEPSKYGKPQTKLLSDLKEYYCTENLKLPMLEDVQKGSLVTLKFTEGKNPRYKQLTQIIRVATGHAPARPQASSPAKESSLPKLPEALSESQITAMMDLAREKTAEYLEVPKAEIVPENALWAIYFNSLLTRNKQQFQLATILYEQAEKIASYRRWHPEAR